VGEPIRLVISVDEETKRILDRWQALFFPLVGDNRSRLFRLAVQTLDRLGFTAETVMHALNHTQRIKLANVEQDVTTFNNSEQVFPNAKKPLVRAPSPRSTAHRGLEVGGVSRRDAANQAWFTSLIIHSTPVNERAA
jgi:hypothetical protein